MPRYPIDRRSALLLHPFFFFCALPRYTRDCLHAAPAQVDELRVTVGFVLNFAKFTRWPETAAVPADEFRIGVLEDEVLADALQTLVAGRTVRGAAISVLRAKSAEEFRTCHIALLGPDSRRKAEQLRVISGIPVLTISTAEGFASHGGMVELFIRDNRMRFAVNRKAVDASGLRISPELQELASPR
jgi:hypothetical protein